jgi:hypothetical protein
MPCRIAPNDQASAGANLRAVRARLLYILSAACEATTNSVYTVTVPNNRVKRLVVSRFDRRDLTLSEEFVPSLSTE